MSNYDKTNKYWLQLKEDWFDDDAIKWLEEQKNGKEYSLFYMKLMLKAIKTNGFLIRKVGELLIPYIPETLAELTRTEIDTVMVAMELLKKIGLVKVLEDGAIYIEQVQEMIGFQSIGAEKKALQRQNKLLLGTESGQVSTKDKDKDKDKDINNNNTCQSSCQEIFNYWNSKEIIKHKEVTDNILKAINKTLKIYNVEEIKIYINRFAEILNNKDYFYNYKWTLIEFLNRKDGISSFADDGSKWISYCEFINKHKTNNTLQDIKKPEKRIYTKEETEKLYTDINNVNLFN
jgi:predicted phage replisome organizer